MNTREYGLTPPAASHASRFARQWMTNLSNSVRVDSNHPVVGARTYAIGGVALYESVVHGMPGHRSLAGQLNGLDSLPTPDPGKEYDWPTVMAATMSVVGVGTFVFPFRVLVANLEFITPSEAALKALGPEQIGFRRTAGVSEAIIQNSVEFGTALGGALAAWADSDGYHDIYRFKAWVPPTGPDKWVPTGFSDENKVANPEEPWWGELRPFVLTHGSECEAPPPVPFSTEPGSPMYEQAYATWDAVVNGTEEQRTISEYWADGPGATATPSGHWVAILTQRVRTMNLADSALAYALLGLGVHDAGISVWYTKYKYNLLRPTTYIRRHIDPIWGSHLPTPQFPEYISGHSGFSGASGTLLDHLFGAAPFTDNTKIRRGFGARTFSSYFEAATEAMESRLYGGIHYPMGNEEGLNTGVCVANKIIERVSFTE